MYIPDKTAATATITHLVRQFGNVADVTKVTDVTKAKKATQVTDVATNVATTATNIATDVATTATDIGKDVKDKGEDGLGMFKDGMSALETLKRLKELWEKYHVAAFYTACVLIAILCILLIYCCWHCCLDIGGCCCNDREWHREDIDAKVVPPPVSQCWWLHCDRTHCARDCGRRRVREGEEWGCCGRKDEKGLGCCYTLMRCKLSTPRWLRATQEFIARRREEGRRVGQTAREAMAKRSQKGKREAGKGKGSREEFEQKGDSE